MTEGITFEDLPEAAVLAAQLVALRSRISYFRSAESTSIKVEVTVEPVAELDFAGLVSTTETTAAEYIRDVCVLVLEQQEAEIEGSLAALGVTVESD